MSKRVKVSMSVTEKQKRISKIKISRNNRKYVTENNSDNQGTTERLPNSGLWKQKARADQ